MTSRRAVHCSVGAQSARAFTHRTPVAPPSHWKRYDVTILQHQLRRVRFMTFHMKSSGPVMEPSATTNPAPAHREPVIDSARFPRR